MLKKSKKLLENKNVLIGLFIILYLVIYYDAYTCNFISPDEGYQLSLNNWSFSKIIYYCSVDYHVPLFAFLVKLFSYLPFRDIMSARILLSLILIAHFFVAFYPLERLTNRKVSLIYSILFLFSPILFYFSLNIRMFSLANLNLFLVMIYALLAFRDDKKSDWIKLFLVSVFSCYSFLLATFITFFILFVMIIYSFLNKEKKLMKKFIICFMLVFLCFIPWIPFLLEQIVNVTSDRYWQYFPYSFMKFFMDITNIYILGFSNGYCINGYVWASFMVLLIFIALSIIFNFCNKNLNKKDNILFILFLVFISSFLFILLYSYVNKTFAARYFTILYSILLLSFIYYFVKNPNFFNISVFIVFIIMFIFNYTGVINSGNLTGNNDLEKMKMYLEKHSEIDEDNVFILHSFESSLEVLGSSYLNDKVNLIFYNNSFLYDDNCGEDQKNILNNYEIFGNNVYTLSDIEDIYNYTDHFYMIFTKELLSKAGSDVCILNNLGWDYKFIDSYVYGYNRVNYNLYEVNISRNEE